MKQSAFDLLKIGIGPSSSHTLGPMRMAQSFRNRLLELELPVHKIEVILKGSLALTGEGHLTPNAVIAGLLGFDPVLSDIEKIQGATLEVERNHGFFLGERFLSGGADNLVKFDKVLTGLRHPNTAHFYAYDADGKLILDKECCSIGGGAWLLADSVKPAGSRNVGEKLSSNAILKYCQEHSLSLLDFAYAQEECYLKIEREEIKAKLLYLWNVMKAAVENGLQQEGHLPGKLNVRRRAKRTRDRYMNRSSQLQKAIPTLAKANIYALAVSEENASGGRIVTAPTCGACGVVPGVLYMLWEELKLSEELIAESLLVASLFGNIVVDRASISGAEVGCQGEVGTACAMASAAACFLSGGTNSQIESAAEAALEHHLGLTCDPVMGLVQVPCIERNAIAAGTAINSANLALLGDGDHLISFDRCVDTLRETGTDMSDKYKETSLGGLATTHC
ncbi:MAG: L-serine ammonia-lyase [Candidatus Cloacimonetes bacterium]|nr:L-serine ammonia-lyase [Candidatus Cloacimonadota bacterium]